MKVGVDSYVLVGERYDVFGNQGVAEDHAQMITQEGYRLLASMSDREREIAVFLLANYNLTRFVSVQPRYLQSCGIKIAFESVYRLIDGLVKAGFLEYGPVVRKYSSRGPTVRLRQKLLMDRPALKKMERDSSARLDREKMIEVSLDAIQNELDIFSTNLRYVARELLPPAGIPSASISPEQESR
jgi:hypothetical protein